MPLKAEDYKRLTHSGLNGVVCFQETYNRARYNVYHPKGMKSKFDWRSTVSTVWGKPMFTKSVWEF